MQREIKRTNAPKKGDKTRVVYQEDIHAFDSLVTTFRLAIANTPNINNKKFAKVVRAAINNNTYGTSQEVLNTLIILYKSPDPLKAFAKLSEVALAGTDDSNYVDMEIDNDNEDNEDNEDTI